ncbi:MAG: tetratricopeptide repeat protein [Arcicella sp.]|nr:tetratricopeptide repeat protein [Arcicella sp.]
MTLEKYYLQAINNGDFDALNNLGLLHYSQNKNKEAEECFLKALEAGNLNALKQFRYAIYIAQEVKC